MTGYNGMDFHALFEASPNPYVLLDRDFTIVGMNAAYLRATMRERHDIIGRGMFEAFPPDPNAQGGEQLRASLERALKERERDHIPLIRYAIPSEGGYQDRYWSATHTPLFDADGEVIYILQHTEDITELQQLREAQARSPEGSARSSQVEGAIFRHAQDVEDTSRIVARERDTLRQMFEQAPGFMAVLSGPDHVFTLANAAYEQLVGARSLVGRSVAQALPEVVDQGFIDLLDRVYATGKPFLGNNTKVVLAAAGGGAEEERYLDFIYQPMTDAAGAVTGIFVQGHDRTDQVRAEMALAESENRFRSMAEGAPVMLWMCDAQGTCEYLNAAQRAFWGVAPEDVPEFAWGSTPHPDDRSRLAESTRQAIATKSPFEIEARIRRADGTYRIIHTTAAPRITAAGECVGMIGVNADLTDIREAEAALRAETGVLEILNRTGSVLFEERDSESVIQAVTDTGVELTGARYGAFFYNVENEAGRRYMLYTLSGAPRSAFDSFPMPRATGMFEPTFKGEGVVRSSDVLADPRYGQNDPYFGMPEGHLPVRSYLAVPVKSRDGTVLGGLLFGHPDPDMFGERAERAIVGLASQAATTLDNARLFEELQAELTQRETAEQALQDLNANLEQQVLERTEQLRRNEEALRQAQKMEAIGNLTGGVAHDFNNLLQVISGNLQLLAKDFAPETKPRQRLDNALAGVERGTRLASQLLAFGRRQPLAPVVVDLGKLIRRMDDMLRRAIGEAIELECVIGGGLWHTFVDTVQIENAILNLAINARDAMDGRGKLTVEAGNAAIDHAYGQYYDVTPGQYVMLAVTDTGRGMTAEVMGQAFEPFFTTKPEGQGTGLGLSQVYGFVKQSGGHVNIYSEPGHGTTIRMYLPRTRRQEEVLDPQTAGPVTGGSETILVVEDDETVRATVVEMLDDLGYTVLKAPDAAKALAIIESGIGIDLLFTDVVMPGPVRSTDLAKRARQILPGIAVLFTSGYTDNAIVHGGRLDEGVNLLSKPYTREALAQRLRGLLGAPATPGDDQALPERPVATPTFKPLRVLVVEDEVLIRMTTIDLLEGLGHTPLESGTGQEALSILESEDVDVLLADIGLPGMSGFDLATQAAERYRDLKVVFASGHAVDPGAVAQVLDGRYAILDKPYDEMSIAAALSEVMPKDA